MVETMLPESQNKRKQKIESTPAGVVWLSIGLLSGWQRVTPCVGVTGIPPLTAFLFGPLVGVAAPVQDADTLMRETPERSAGDLAHLLIAAIVSNMFDRGHCPAEGTRQQISGGYLHSLASIHDLYPSFRFPFLLLHAPQMGRKLEGQCVPPPASGIT